MESPKPSEKPKSGGTEWWWILLLVFVVFFFIVVGFFALRSMLNSPNNSTNVIKNIRVNNTRIQ